MGHALGTTIEDILIRWRRMGGYNAMWLPGTDHAGIATQMVVERELREKEKQEPPRPRPRRVRRARLGLEADAPATGSSSSSSALGCSLDWDRTTLHDGPGVLARRCVEAFVRLYEEGLIYRARRLINWCPSCRTALSDLEVDHDEGTQGELYEFAYPLADGSGEIVVATTRPETMLGDTAVAVHPDDPRYKAQDRQDGAAPASSSARFPIIADAILVDPKFGTGAVKVTPAHDSNDFETGQRHKLPMISDPRRRRARSTPRAAPFAGLDRFEARKAVKAKLEGAGPRARHEAARARGRPLPALRDRSSSRCCRRSGS